MPLVLEPLAESTDFSLYGEHKGGIAFNIDALWQAVENIFAEKKYESFFRYDKGLSLDETLFKVSDDHLSKILVMQITDGVKEQEPRIRQVKVDVTRYPESKETVMNIQLITSEYGLSAPRRYIIRED